MNFIKKILPWLLTLIVLVGVFGVIKENLKTGNAIPPEVSSQAILPSCTDSDGGYDRFKYGKVQLFGAPENIVPQGEDKCIDSKSGAEVSSCLGDSCTMKEYYCADADKDNINETYNAFVENAPCPDGCNNGACITK